MTNLLEIEAAIKQLPENDVRQLATWLQNYLNDLCDRVACALARIGKSNQI